MKSVKTLALSCLAAVGFVASGVAHAALGPVTICIDNPDNLDAAVCAVDGGAGDFNPLAGEVTLLAFGGSLGLSFSSALGNATGEPNYGGPSAIGFHFDSFVNGGPGTLVASISQTGLTIGGTGPTAFLSNLGGNLGSGASVSYEVFIDDQNRQFEANTLVGSGTFNGSTNAVSSGSASVDGEFSLSAFVTFSHLQPYSSSSINMSVDVPEPGILALVGLGLAGLGVSGRRKAKATA